MSDYQIETRRATAGRYSAKWFICTEEERLEAARAAIAEVAGLPEEYQEPLRPPVAVYHSTIAGLMS